MADPTFASDIKPLFREKDRNSMLRRFDLWSLADVTCSPAGSPAARRSDRPASRPQ
jgi:hypothetical protein